MAESPKVAMVFAAGFGKRMLPITKSIPKPLVKINGKALIDYALEGLAKFGIQKAVVNSHHLAEILHKHLQTREPEPEILISYEEDILETGGGIVKALPMLGSAPFFSVNSDVIVLDCKDGYLNRMVEMWDADKMDVLMLLQPTESAVGYEGVGDFSLTDDYRITKENSSDGCYPYVFTGVMLSKPEIYSDLELKPFSVYRDFIQPRYSQDDGSLARVYGIVHNGGWVHVGTPDSIDEAETYLNTYK